MGTYLTAFMLVLGTLVSGAHADQAAVPAAAKPSASYRVGPADILRVVVVDEKELSNNYSVDSDGTITYPYLGRIEVRGKTLNEIETLITTGLRNGIILRAQVLVEIATYRSRSILVLGEVKSAGKYIIEEGQVTLLEVIAKAGGFTTAAGPIITLQRYKDGIAATVAAAPTGAGTKGNAELMTFNVDDLKNGRLNANVVLQDSDTIIVPAADRYYVTGFVKSPGSFVLRAGMTVGQAIAEAGGITERGSRRRISITRTINGKPTEIGAKEADPVRPNDTIAVKQRLI